jgi:hypothetical protein
MYVKSWKEKPSNLDTFKGGGIKQRQGQGAGSRVLLLDIYMCILPYMLSANNNDLCLGHK